MVVAAKGIRVGVERLAECVVDVLSNLLCELNVLAKVPRVDGLEQSTLFGVALAMCPPNPYWVLGQPYPQQDTHARRGPSAVWS